MNDHPDALLTAARALIDAVSHDDNGSMIAGRWIGGNGGLLSRATIKAADDLRQLLDHGGVAKSATPATKGRQFGDFADGAL